MMDGTNFLPLPLPFRWGVLFSRPRMEMFSSESLMSGMFALMSFLLPVDSISVDNRLNVDLSSNITGRGRVLGFLDSPLYRLLSASEKEVDLFNSVSDLEIGGWGMGELGDGGGRRKLLLDLEERFVF